MSDRTDAEDPLERTESDTRDELRTIAFRLREIQRLVGARVEQENRRLEAEGLDPVTERGFFKGSAGHDRERPETTRHLVETLGNLDVFEEAVVTLADGTGIRGRVNPVTYTPNDHLRVEIRPHDEDARYDLRADYTGDDWTDPVVRRCVSGDDGWTEIGELGSIRPVD